ncbi:hypothetical protein SLS55_001090 [Diplodia seriata]|uniref:Altered inheritance of mitochondria protein 21 n=1 Tax=Diplodia seriata TaxID=420778 RepID=A0ABR3CW71_9PEZI
MAAPSIPQRPSRSQQSQNVPTITGDVPQIPARPKRSIERSVSPNRDTFARSPLNDPSFVNGSSNASKRLSASDLPPRPPSVTLPSIGQEGSEYASLETPPADESAPKETRDAEGLKLYAPTAEMPRSTARSRIAAVTRTDSQQAAAAGFGRAPSQDTSVERHTRNSSSTGRRSRPTSIYNNGDEEHGIPEIGLQVPMYPNAGDVQAPTPSNSSSMPATGVGFFNSGGQRHHARTKSGHEIFHGPPGSYGLHGHGVKPQDEFERQWYAKHPHDAAREAQGEYGPAIRVNRKEWALSSDELNKIVQDTAAKGVGMGASPGAIGTPAEEIGYMASEEYASRMASPQPQSKAPKERKTSSQTHLESPLRKTSFPENVMDKDSSAIEADEDDVIHINPPTNERSHIHGGGPEADDFAPRNGSTDADDGFVTEEGGRTPILASDELQRHKTPGAEYMQPAVPAELERERRLSQEADNYHRRSTSRSASRPTSGIGLSRWSEDDRNGTPLDNVKEYEPLFPDEDEKKPAEKPVTAVDKLKRPDLARHHFPSQDVWEDTPSSLQLQTEVETPEAPDEPQSATTSMQSSQLFERPETEQERKEEPAPKQEEEKSFLADHQKHPHKSHFNKDVLNDMPSRPGMQQRFPSQDIWEDTPSELQLVTEVHAPQTDETESPVEPKSTTEQRPPVPARPHVPARPAGRSKLGESQEASPVDKKAPVIPDRPKPQLPARPAKPNHKPSDEQVPLSKVGSQGSTGSEGAPATKAKPPVPSRPAGGKIAALKAGFLSDLNSRLQLGPQAPKPEKKEEEEEEPKEKAPLADARKGRARGPARRKPAASPSAAAAVAPAEAKKEQALSIGTIQTVFSISDDGDLTVPSLASAKEPEAAKKELPAAAEASIATQVPADPKPAPKDDPAEPELEPRIPKADETEATQVESTPAAEEEKETELEPTETKTSDSAVQTGQQDIEIPKEDGGAEKITAYLGANAPEEGNVVVNDGAEAVEKVDDKHEPEQASTTA